MNKTIILATSNEGKIAEIKQILDSDFKFLTSDDFSDWPDVPETGSIFFENALIKAKALSEKYGFSAIADDSGLEVEALEGRPGVNSARYAGEEQNDSKNIEKLLSELQEENNRKARFVTVAVYYESEDGYLAAEGEVKGEITNVQSGENGFGYDPVFKPDGFEVTMAQLELEEKNKISHRGKAFRKLKEKLNH